MRKVWLPALVALSAAGLLPATGCGKPDDGLSSEQHQQADRLDDIAKKSDGDWNRVSQADRDYVMKNFAFGNEQSARMLLLGKAGKLGGHPGGPPAK